MGSRARRNTSCGSKSNPACDQNVTFPSAVSYSSAQRRSLRRAHTPAPTLRTIRIAPVVVFFTEHRANAVVVAGYASEVKL